MGHLNPKACAKLANGLVLGTTASPIACLELANRSCQVCLQTKRQQPYPSTGHSAAAPLEIISSDICELPSLAADHTGKRYLLTFMDHHTRASFVRCLAEKGEAPGLIVAILTRLQRQHDRKVKVFQSDNGGEYVNGMLKAFFSAEGIVHDALRPLHPPRCMSACSLAGVLLLTDPVNGRLFRRRWRRQGYGAPPTSRSAARAAGRAAVVGARGGRELGVLATAAALAVHLVAARATESAAVLQAALAATSAVKELHAAVAVQVVGVKEPAVEVIAGCLEALIDLKRMRTPPS
jgi:hypothetical protein